MTKAFLRNDKWYSRYHTWTDQKTVIKTKGGFSCEKEAILFSDQMELKYQSEKAASLEIASAPSKVESVPGNSDIKCYPILKSHLVEWYEEVYSKQIRPETNLRYRYALYDKILPFLDKKLHTNDFSRSVAEEIVQTAGVMAASYSRIARDLLNVYAKSLVRDGLLDFNPIPLVKPIYYPKRAYVIPSPEQLRDLILEAKKHPWYLETLLLVVMGLRKSEIYGLKESDIIWDKRLLFVQRQIISEREYNTVEVVKSSREEAVLKTINSYRILYIPWFVLDEIRLRVDQNQINKRRLGDQYFDKGLLCCQQNGKPRFAAYLNKALNDTFKKVEASRFSVHFTRHILATILLEGRVPLKEISTALGHNSIETTYTYYCDILQGNKEALKLISEDFATLGYGSMEQIKERLEDAGYDWGKWYKRVEKPTKLVVLPADNSVVDLGVDNDEKKKESV